MYINKYDTKSVDEHRGSVKPHPSMQSKFKCLHVLKENIFDNAKFWLFSEKFLKRLEFYMPHRKLFP